ncbi:hypothetical protein ACEPAH_7289 [Sanghuangporus vaninii]
MTIFSLLGAPGTFLESAQSRFSDEDHWSNDNAPLVFWPGTLAECPAAFGLIERPTVGTLRKLVHQIPSVPASARKRKGKDNIITSRIDPTQITLPAKCAIFLILDSNADMCCEDVTWRHLRMPSDLTGNLIVRKESGSRTAFQAILRRRQFGASPEEANHGCLPPKSIPEMEN